MTYEHLNKEAAHQGLSIYERSLSPNIKGLYGDRIIWINKTIPTNIEKGCVLAEELGHYHTSTGDLLDQRQLTNRKQELRARVWGYEKLVPLSAFIEAHKTGTIRNRHDLAEFLNVTESFLDAAVKSYIDKYGLYAAVDHFTVCFEPLGVLEMFE